MQSFSLLNSSTHNQHYTWAHSQNDVHAGRLFCWSGALVTISLWTTVQFFDGENRQWCRQHLQTNPTKVSEQTSLPPPPQTAAFWRRFEQRPSRRAALAHALAKPIQTR